MTNQNESNNNKLLAMKALHFSITAIVFFVFFLLFRYGSIFQIAGFGFRYNYFSTIAYCCLLGFFNKTYNSYLVGYTRIRNLVFGQALSQTFSLIIIYSIISISWGYIKSPLPFLLMLALQVLFDIVWSYFINGYFYKLQGKRRTLLIYRNQLDKKRFGSIAGKPTERIYKITDELQYDGTFSELKERLKGFDAIFVAGVNSSCRNGILKYCKEENIPGFFLPHIGDILMQEATHIQAFESPVLYINRKVISLGFALVKRGFDILSSGLTMILLSPIFLVTALAIKIYDGGPILYKQTRLTKNEKRFEILKFRSMRVDAEGDGIARLSTGKNDDRVTPVGRIIRRFRLDELPQLWNIFIGDMSVVGPRPERPEIAEMYYKKMPDFKLRLQVKAGLTGYAQVYGKYNTSPYEKLEFDLLYINDMNVLTDLKLCFATFAILFLPESTEGVAAGETTAMDCENEAFPSNDGENGEDTWIE